MRDKNQGITLIALIVTIIIMLILLAVTIDIAVNGGLLDNAKNTVDKTNDKVAKTQNRVDELLSELNQIESEQTVNNNTGGDTTECEHAWGEWNIEIEETCTTNGTKKRTCTKCNVQETQTIEAVGHTYTDYEITTKPTTTSTGIATSTCTKCGVTQTMEVPKLEENGKFTFTIDDVEYNAEDEMTWNSWVLSAYNTGGYEVKTTMGYGYVTTSGGAKYLKPSTGSFYVQSNAKIISGGTYITAINYGAGY